MTNLSKFSAYLADKKVSFGLASDSHYADRDPWKTRFYRDALLKMEGFVETMNSTDTDFVLHLGDFKDENPRYRDSVHTLGLLRELEEVFTEFDGPTYHCIGNHDVDSITKQEFLANITNTGIDSSRNYYDFEYGGIRFIVLDAAYRPDGTDHFFKEGGNWQDAHLPETQLSWLEDKLEESDKPAVIFCHYLLFECVRGPYRYHVKNHVRVRELLEKSGKVLAVFQGHIHETYKTRIGGIYYFTLPAMIDFEGREQNTFARIEIEKGMIKINGFGRMDTYWLS